MLKFIIKIMALMFLCVGLSHAGTSSDELSTCLTNSTSGKDRINLARWVFAGMAAHPEVANIANVIPEKKDEINKTMANLLTRLIAEDCKKEINITVKNDSQAALKLAFESLGRMAMLELMSNKSVSEEFDSMDKYVDKEKIKAAMQQ